MRPGFFSFAVGASLLLCGATVVVGLRSYHHPSRFGISTSQARYTFHSAAGRLALYRPPDPGPQNALAWKIASQISNNDAGWRVLVGSAGFRVMYQFRPGSPSSQMITAFPFPGGISSAAPPLLKALEDPKKAATAHLCLVRMTARGMASVTPATNDDWATAYFDLTPYEPPMGLPVRFRQLTGGSVEPDTSSWRDLRDLWHDRLDVKVFSINYGWLVVATVLLPLVWLADAWRRTLRTGHCFHCGYNLRGNTSGICPECGAPVKIETETISN